jgi:hyperosmotically inducible protein
VSDADLTNRVKSAVLAQPLSALMFNVSVSNGIVTLSGTADSTDTREKAGRAAADVEGVRSVNNRISVLSGS